MDSIQKNDYEKLLRRKLDLLLKTGQMLVESAADTNRIMRNMNRVAAFLGLPEEHLHIYVQFNMLMVNLSDGEHSFTKFQRCSKHGINMTTISLVSRLSWRAIEGTTASKNMPRNWRLYANVRATTLRFRWR